MNHKRSLVMGRFEWKPRVHFLDGGVWIWHKRRDWTIRRVRNGAEHFGFAFLDQTVHTDDLPALEGPWPFRTSFDVIVSYGFGIGIPAGLRNCGNTSSPQLIASGQRRGYSFLAPSSLALPFIIPFIIGHPAMDSLPISMCSIMCPIIFPCAASMR